MSRLSELLSGVVGPAEHEISCEECFDGLDRYVELELAGARVTTALPGFGAHLRGCPACREDYESLKAFVGGAS